MKYLRLLNILPIGLFIFALLALPAMAYTIDGDLSDWGVSLSTAYSNDYTKNTVSDGTGWIPGNAHPTVDWIVENNVDPTRTNGNPRAGTHKKGTGATSNQNIEGLLRDNILQPSGGEPYDIEAVYFDDDAQNMYLGIVTSLPKAGNDGWMMGDIALDITHPVGSTGNNVYEYGIKVLSSDPNKVGLIRYKPTWTNPVSGQFPASGPYTFSEGSGSAVGAGGSDVCAYLKYLQTSNEQTGEKWSNSLHRYVPVYDDNYVIEMSIPKSAIGSPSVDTTGELHLTIECGNDEIELTPMTFKHNIPEFPSIVLPIAAIMGMILILGRRKNE